MAMRSTMRKPANSYSQVQVNTAGPGRRVVMMYDGIIKNLRSAKAAMTGGIQPNQIETVHNQLQLAEKLILELQLALDHDNGGELASTLDGLYAFWMDRISEANLKKDPNLLKEVLDMAKELRDAWDQAAKAARRQGII